MSYFFLLDMLDINFPYIVISVPLAKLFSKSGHCICTCFSPVG